MKINFCVVFRVGDHLFLPRREEEAWSVTPSEIWTFGTPKTGVEVDLQKAAREAERNGNVDSHHFE